MKSSSAQSAGPCRKLFMAAFIVSMVVPLSGLSQILETPQQEDNIEPEAASKAGAIDNEKTLSSESEGKKVSVTNSNPSEAGIVRFIAERGAALKVTWRQEPKKETWSGDALRLEAGTGTLLIEREGYFRAQTEWTVPANEVSLIAFDLEPIPHYGLLQSLGWLGVGVGGFLVAGSVAVQDIVDFDSPRHKESTQFSLLGSGLILSTTGLVLLHQLLNTRALSLPKALSLRSPSSDDN